MTAKSSSGDSVKMTADEAVAFYAKDHIAYSHYFFPKACRSKSPSFHRELWKVMTEPSLRLINLMVFRGGAKTTLTRLYASHRIAYGLSNTILIIGLSDDAAMNNLDWLKKNIDDNHRWTKFYGLSRGGKWQANDIEVRNHSRQMTIRVKSIGIQGSTRGFNADDYRPDLIILDDCLSTDNSLTEDGRKKVSQYIYGDVLPSLSVRSLSPLARVISLATPQHEEDYASLAFKREDWRSLRIGVFTKPGEPDPETCRSRWESAYPAADMVRDYQINKGSNMSANWLREYQCEHHSPADRIFDPRWLNIDNALPEGGDYFIGIDPAPPVTDTDSRKGQYKRDYEVFATLYSHEDKVWLVDIRRHRGHTAAGSVSVFKELVGIYNPSLAVCEAHAYQRTLQSLLEGELRKSGSYTRVVGLVDKRRKYERIVQALSQPAYMGKFRLFGNHPTFIEEFSDYGQALKHDDVLDATATALIGKEQFPGFFRSDGRGRSRVGYVDVPYPY